MTDKLAAEEQFTEAYHLPPGMPRHEALERAARAADAADHQQLAVSCRVALIRSCYDLGRYDLMLAPFAWCTAAEKRGPEDFGRWESHTFDWCHKWIANGLRRDPRFSLAQLDAVVEQFANRYRRHGFSQQPVHGVRAMLALHVGDDEAYREHLTKFLALDRGPMSDCEACVVEDQATHLIRLGRHAEAVALAEPVLRQDTTCSTQPQGILTALLPAFIALGDHDRASNAHLVACRLIKDDQLASYLNAHLEFCATSGHVARGVELLSGHLRRVHHSTSPAEAMDFAAAAALLLSRVTDDLEFEVLQPDGITTRALRTAELRAELEESALAWAKRFDERNGTTAVGDRVRETLLRPDREHVPLAVPVLTPASLVEEQEEPDVAADPVELAERANAAFDAGDFVTGSRLLRTLPADMDALLPDALAAQLMAKRLTATASRISRERLLAGFADVVAQLDEAGEPDLANRYRTRLAVWRLPEDGLEASTALAEDCLAEADSDGTPFTAVLARLVLAELLDHAHDHERAESLIASALAHASASAPELLARVRVDRDEHLARRRDLDGALAAVVEVLASEVSESVRFDGMRIKLRLETVLEQGEAALRTAGELVARAARYPGRWRAEAERLRAITIEELGQEATHLGELRDAVAACREFGGEAHTAQACYSLSGGYLKTGRLVEAAETLEEALRLVQSAGAEAELGLQVRFRLGQTCAQLGENQAALRHLETALEHIGEDEHWQRAVALDALANARRRLDLLVESSRTYAEAAECWEVIDQPGEAAGSWVEAANVLPAGESARGLASLERASALLPGVEDAGARTHIAARISAIRAFLHAQAGEFELAVAQNAVAESAAVELGDVGWQAFLVARGGRFRLSAGDAVAAEGEARRAASLLGDETPGEVVAEVVSVLQDALGELDRPTGTDPLVRALTARLEM
jgi:tetratricopeptide (TPR) repeat protein